MGGVARQHPTELILAVHTSEVGIGSEEIRK